MRLPYWRVASGEIGLERPNRKHCVEGTWGAKIIADLERPQEGDNLIVKKGLCAGSRTLPSIRVLRIWVRHDCVVSGLTTCVCVVNDPSGVAFEYNYSDDRRERCGAEKSSGHARKAELKNNGAEFRRSKDHRLKS